MLKSIFKKSIIFSNFFRTLNLREVESQASKKSSIFSKVHTHVQILKYFKICNKNRKIIEQKFFLQRTVHSWTMHSIHRMQSASIWTMFLDPIWIKILSKSVSNSNFQKKNKKNDDFFNTLWYFQIIVERSIEPKFMSIVLKEVLSDL